MWPAVEAGHERGQQHPSEHVEEEQRGAAQGVRLDGTCVTTRAMGCIQSGLQPNPMFQAHRGMDELFKWSSQVCKVWVYGGEGHAQARRIREQERASP